METGAVLVHDGRFEYETGGAFPRSVCRLRMYEGGACLILVASELADNPGASITNTAELLATALVQRWGIDPERAVLIEHYDPASYRGLPREPTFDLLTFRWFGGCAAAPRWARLIGADLAAFGLPDDIAVMQRVNA